MLVSDSDSESDDPEKKKMMSKLDSAIVGEKPNVAWYDHGFVRNCLKSGMSTLYIPNQ